MVTISRVEGQITIDLMSVDKLLVYWPLVKYILISVSVPVLPDHVKRAKEKKLSFLAPEFDFSFRKRPLRIGACCRLR